MPDRLHEEIKTRSRWIILGHIMGPTYHIMGNSGFPECLLVTWKGEEDVFCPWEFFSWRDLIRIADRKLAFAGLKRRAIAVEIGGLRKAKALLVQVQRDSFKLRQRWKVKGISESISL